MDILDKIIASKQKEVKYRKTHTPINQLEKSEHFHRNPLSMVNALTHGNSSHIIAEFKRKSPSKGIINDKADVEKVTQAYRKARCAGVSILTDQPFFGGSPSDLQNARPHLQIPILRKDFMIDSYQVIESKAMGADLILLIAEALTASQIKQLASLAKELGLEVLLEMHSVDQLTKITAEVDIIGINNRDLKTFNVDINTSLSLAEKIPNEFVKISESGISDANSIIKLMGAGYQGFLIGENFMKTEDPGISCQTFVKNLTALKLLW